MIKIRDHKPETIFKAMLLKTTILKALYFCLLPFAFCLVFNGCAYFNAYYLAQKNFKDGEYARKRNDGVADEKAKMKYKTAIKWSKEVIEKYEGSRYTDDSMYIIGLSYYYQNEFVLARTQLDELLNVIPAQAGIHESKYIEEAKYYKARSYMGLEQYDNARKVLNELIKSDNRSIMGRAGLALAEISSNNEKWDELLIGAQTVIDTEPEKKELITATVYKGEALYQLGRYEECLTMLEKLGDFDPRFLSSGIDPYLRFRTNTRIAQSKAKLGNYDEGLKYLTDMENRGEYASYAPKIRLEIGYIYELQENYDLAVDTYKKMAGDFPDSLAAKDAWYRVGNIIIRDFENAEEAKEAYNMVGEPPKGAHEPWFVDAKIKSTQIDSMTARIEQIKNLKDDVKARTGTRFSLAELYTYSFNRPDSALTQYRLILSEAPDTEYAVMSDFYIKMDERMKNGQYSKDIEREIIMEIIELYPDSEFTGKLRTYIGVEDNTPHVQALKKAETARFSGQDLEEYIPLYHAVVDSFPDTRSSYQAQFVLAYSYEHDAENMDKAMEYYESLASETPTFFSREYIEKAREKLTYYKEEPKLLEEINEYIAGYESRKESGTLGMETSVQAVETSTSTNNGYTGLRRIRDRNARIRSRYFTD